MLKEFLPTRHGDFCQLNTRRLSFWTRLSPPRPALIGNLQCRRTVFCPNQTQQFHSPSLSDGNLQMASYAGYIVVCIALAVDSDAGVALAVT